jgi:phospholipid transport system transporter-binding protein
MSVAVATAKIDFLSDKIALTGFLVFDTVLTIYQSGIDYLEQYTLPELEIDLSKVEKSDSSGLSVFLGWMRVAQKKNIKLQFTYVPQYLVDVAKLSGIEDILPISVVQ